MAASPLCRQPAWLTCCGVQHPSQVRCNSFGRLTALFLHLELAPRHVAESCFFKVSEGFGDCQGERQQISFTFTCLIECHMAASPLCRQLTRLARYEVQHPSQVWCKSFGRPTAFFLHLELALLSFCRVLCFSKGLRALATVSPVLGPNHVILGWFSNRTGTSVDDWKARGKDSTRLLVPNLPLCYWSSHLFDLRAPSSSDALVLLLSQPIVQRLDEQSLVLQVGDWLGQSPVPINQEQYRNLEYYKSLSFGPLSWLS